MGLQRFGNVKRCAAAFEGVACCSLVRCALMQQHRPNSDLMAKREAFESLIIERLKSYNGSCLLSDLITDPNVQVAASPLLQDKSVSCLLHQLIEVKLFPLQHQQHSVSDSVVSLASLHEDYIPPSLLAGTPWAATEEARTASDTDQTGSAIANTYSATEKRSLLTRLLELVWGR